LCKASSLDAEAALWQGASLWQEAATWPDAALWQEAVTWPDSAKAGSNNVAVPLLQRSMFTTLLL